MTVNRTKAVVAIKGGHEAKTLKEEADDTGVDDDKVASRGRSRPTKTTTVPDAANVDNDRATNGRRRCPTTVTDAAGVDNDEVASGGRHRPTTATTVADVANVDDNKVTNGIAGGTPREDPADGTPRKKARSGEAAVNRTKAVAAIKGGREAESLKEEADDAGIDDDKVTSGGRRRPTTATTVAAVANVNDDKATNGGRHCPTTVTDPAPSHHNRCRRGQRR